jgi:uncharacterized membrane protein (UPF0127 family)
MYSERAQWMDDNTNRTTPSLRSVSEPDTGTLHVRGIAVCRRLRSADTMLTRMRGLLGKKSLEQGEGIWITPCNAIHMFFMRFPIDAVFVDRNLQVVRVHEHVRPWRMARGGRHAHSVFELPSGTAAFHGIKPGDRLQVDWPIR